MELAGHGIVFFSKIQKRTLSKNLFKTALYASWALLVKSLLLPKQLHISGLYGPSIQVAWMYLRNTVAAVHLARSKVVDDVLEFRQKEEGKSQASSDQASKLLRLSHQLPKILLRVLPHHLVKQTAFKT